MKISGLSGISDIIGEMVEKGDIDLEEAGFEPDEAQFIVEKMKHRYFMIAQLNQFNFMLSLAGSFFFLFALKHIKYSV